MDLFSNNQLDCIDEKSYVYNNNNEVYNAIQSGCAHVLMEGGPQELFPLVGPNPSLSIWYILKYLLHFIPLDKR